MVLSTDGVQFTDANMQSHGTQRGSSELFFQNIDFASVYHDEHFSPAERAAIVARRSAEVLVPSPLELRGGGLQWIYCRSPAERTYLLDLLNDVARYWEPRIRVSDDIRVFEKRYTYVESVDISDDGVIFSIAPRMAGGDVNVELRATDVASGNLVISLAPQMLSPIPSQENKNWIVRQPIAAGRYRVEIWLEGCKAFSAILMHESVPF